MEVKITNENFESLKNGELPLVVDFWATWCGPCKAIAPLVEELAKEYDGKIVVGKCDVEENDDIAMEFGIRNIPTILFIKDGKVAEKKHPDQPKRLVNVIKCTNPRCITSIEEGCDHIFALTRSGRYRCIYCEQEFRVKP